MRLLVPYDSRSFLTPRPNKRGPNKRGRSAASPLFTLVAPFHCPFARQGGQPATPRVDVSQANYQSD